MPHGCDHPGNISEYTINITPLPEPICEPIPEGSGCYPKGSSIAMPNMLGMTSSQSVYTGFEMFFGFFILFQSCHEYLKAFLCYYGYPKCEKTAENVNRRILPCKQFCEEVTQACQKEFGVVGIPQLVQYKCPLLPDADEDTSCFFPVMDCYEPSANNTNGGKWIYNSTIRGSKAHLVCPSGHMVYSHCLTPGLGPRPGQGPGRMGCMVLIRAFHTAPGQGQGQGQGPGPGKTQMGAIPIFQVLKMFPVLNTRAFIIG